MAYKGICANKGEVVEESEAFEYAFEKVTSEGEEQNEFFGYLRKMFEVDQEERKLFIDWFYSGNWIKEDDEEED